MMQVRFEKFHRLIDRSNAMPRAFAGFSRKLSARTLSLAHLKVIENEIGLPREIQARIY